MSRGPERERSVEYQPGSPEHRAGHHIAVFGSGSKEKKYRRTLRVAKEVARALMLESGFRLVTGGINTGIMHVVAHEAMKIAREAKRRDLIPKGIAPKGLPRWSRTPGKIEVEKDNKRTGRLVNESDGYVVFNGSFGTQAELDYALCDDTRAALHKPVVILDESGRHVQFTQRLLNRGLVTLDMLHDVYVVTTPAEAHLVLELYYRKRYGLPIDEHLVEKLYALHVSHHLSAPKELSAPESVENNGL